MTMPEWLMPPEEYVQLVISTAADRENNKKKKKYFTSLRALQKFGAGKTAT